MAPVLVNKAINDGGEAVSSGTLGRSDPEDESDSEELTYLWPCVVHSKEVVQGRRIGRICRLGEVLVGRVLRQGGVPDSLLPQTLEFLGLHREKQLLIWDWRRLRIVFEWWENTWRRLDDSE